MFFFKTDLENKASITFVSTKNERFSEPVLGQMQPMNDHSQLGDFCCDVTTSHLQDAELDVTLLRIYASSKILGPLKINIQHPNVDN